MTTKDFDIDRSLSRHAMAGVALVAIMVGGVGGWAVTTQFSGAVVAPGTLVVSSNLKKVQHPTGGIIGELRVRDGDRVRAGDVLARLDETVTRANLAIIEKGLTEQMAREARLQAERDGLDAVATPAAFRENAGDVGVRDAMAGERRSFAERRAAREGQKAQLRERIAQYREQISGLEQQLRAKDREGAFVAQELIGLRQLWQKRMLELGKLIPLERDAERIAGEHGGLVAEIAQVRAKIAECELQVIQVDVELRSDVGKDLADVRARVAELVERRIAARDQLARVEIRAPLDGIVHQQSVHTVGGVVSAGEPLMMIVPEADSLEVETHINPQDIDQVHDGQQAVLRFASFNQRTTPEIDGRISYVSADLSTDQHTGVPYYTARISIPADAVSRLGTAKLMPGMPVESFVQTTPRTVLSYLTKPLLDQVDRAFREGR